MSKRREGNLGRVEGEDEGEGAADCPERDHNAFKKVLLSPSGGEDVGRNAILSVKWSRANDTRDGPGHTHRETELQKTKDMKRVFKEEW